MPNMNCLAGLECPKCGSEGPFHIAAKALFEVHDEGVEHQLDVEWGDKSPCTCNECSHRALVQDFKISNHPDWRADLRLLAKANEFGEGDVEDLSVLIHKAIERAGEGSVRVREGVLKNMQDRIDALDASSSKLYSRLELLAQVLDKEYIISGSIGPLMDSGYVMAMKMAAGMVRRVAAGEAISPEPEDWHDVSFRLTLEKIQKKYPKCTDFDIRGDDESDWVALLDDEGEVIASIEMGAYETLYFVDVPSDEKGYAVPGETVHKIKVGPSSKHLMDVNLPDGQSLEVWQLGNGGLIGIDASFTDQVSYYISDPYNMRMRFILRDEEGVTVPMFVAIKKYGQEQDVNEGRPEIEIAEAETEAQIKRLLEAEKRTHTSDQFDEIVRAVNENEAGSDEEVTTWINSVLG